MGCRQRAFSRAADAVCAPDLGFNGISGSFCFARQRQRLIGDSCAGTTAMLTSPHEDLDDTPI